MSTTTRLVYDVETTSQRRYIDLKTPDGPYPAEFRQHYDEAMQHMVVTLTAALYARTIGSEYRTVQFSIDVPAGWWQHFKQWLNEWLGFQWFRIGTKQITHSKTVRFDAKAVLRGKNPFDFERQPYVFTIRETL